MGKILKDAVKRNWAFWICLGLSILMLVSAFIIPPPAEIDGSVLTAVGELFGFASLGILANAIDKGLDARVRHGDTTIEVGDFNNKPREEDIMD